MQALAASAIRNIRQCDAKNLANPAWSFSKLELALCPLLDAIASEARARIREL